MQRPGDAAAHPGQRVAVPDRAVRRGRRRGRVPAGVRRPARPVRRDRRRAAPAAAAVPRPAGVRRRAHLLGRLGRRTRCPPRDAGVHDLAAHRRDAAHRGGRGARTRCSTCASSPRPTPRRSPPGCRPSSIGTPSGWPPSARSPSGCPSTCAPRRSTRSPRRRRCRSSSPQGLEFLGSRRGGAALLPVHERGHGASSGSPPRSPRCARSEPSLGLDAARQARCWTRGPTAHSWFTFQIAFILLQVEAMLPTGAAAPRPATRRRSSCCSSPPAAARPRRTSAWRRTRSRSGAGRASCQSADGPLDGGGGVTVLMRYTLRLLTAQQFQRAATLVCAAELARRDDPATWGSRAVPDRAVGRHRRVSPKRVDEADEQLRRANEYGAATGSPSCRSSAARGAARPSTRRSGPRRHD